MTFPLPWVNSNCVVEISPYTGEDTMQCTSFLPNQRQVPNEAVECILIIRCRLCHYLHLQCQDTLKYENNRFITVFEGLFYCNNRGGNSGKRFEEWEIPQPMEMYDKQALKKKKCSYTSSQPAVKIFFL